jgi:(E)-4-hydroxy-3-methylbut-2-enyl-diphosphate synthase
LNVCYQRRPSSVVRIGNTPLGGDYPIRIQSMATVSTLDTEAAVQQAVRLIKTGAEYVRFTAQGEREACQLGIIREKLRAQGYDTPLVADIHFNPKAAEVAAVHVEKVRINPGNYVNTSMAFNHIDDTEESYAVGLRKIRERFVPFLRLCRQHHTAIRLGVNHGSLSERIMNRYGDTPDGMVASCMEFLRICSEEDFNNVVISIKASNTALMVQTVRLLVRTMEAEDMHYPLHLGVTEAGDDEDGRIKSAAGIGALLVDGIGDTIRVSLSEPPEAEIPVARKLLEYVQQRKTCASVEVSNTFHSDFNRRTRIVHGIGGAYPPVVISDRSFGCPATNDACRPDFVYCGTNVSPGTDIIVPQIVDVEYRNFQPDAYPYFRAATADQLIHCFAPIKFLEVANSDLNKSIFRLLREDPSVVIVWNGCHQDVIGEARAFASQLKEADCDAPLILRRRYETADKETLQIRAAVDFGSLLMDGIGNGIMLGCEKVDSHITDRWLFSILQAVRLRISKTEYISCPGCGRTLYDLQTTIARVKAATSHLKGLKIGIMGCIVNGPGEMADADYGYVGAARGRISLYKGKTCILKNIPETEAVSQLVGLIKESGDWRSP